MATPKLTNEFSGFLKPEEAAPIFDEVAKRSIVQQVARQIPLGATGVEIPYWDGNVAAQWTAEGAPKQVVEGSLKQTTITPHKIAAIFVMSSEVVRANPGNYINIMREKVAESMALAFDAAVLHGTAQGTHGVNNYVGATALTASLVDPGGAGVASETNAYKAVNNALSLLVNSGKKMNGLLLDDVSEPIINNSVDGNGRPLFLDPTYTETNSTFRQGRVLGRPAYLAENVADGAGVVGYAGDWTKLVWGQVGGISFDVSDQASVDTGSGLVSLWQKNLVAVRAEAEFGFLVHDPAAFVKLTNIETA